MGDSEPLDFDLFEESAPIINTQKGDAKENTPSNNKKKKIETPSNNSQGHSQGQNQNKNKPKTSLCLVMLLSMILIAESMKLSNGTKIIFNRCCYE